MKQSMSLTGGLDMYTSEFGKRYDSDISPKGRRVRFLDENGYDIERENAKNYFKKDDTLTVKEIYFGRSKSYVEFEEFPNINFNTVMFKDVDNLLIN